MDGRLSFPLLELATEGIIDDDGPVLEQRACPVEPVKPVPEHVPEVIARVYREDRKPGPQPGDFVFEPPQGLVRAVTVDACVDDLDRRLERRAETSFQPSGETLRQRGKFRLDEGVAVTTHPEARLRAQLFTPEAPRVDRHEGAASPVGGIVAEELTRSRSEGVEIARVQAIDEPSLRQVAPQEQLGGPRGQA